MRWLNKIAKPISALSMADPALICTYQYWSDLKQQGLLPPRCAVDTPAYRLMVPDTQWFDVKLPNWRKNAFLGSLDPYSQAEPWATTDKHQHPSLAESLHSDLESVIASGAPLFQLIQIEVCGSILFYQHLILPTADDGCLVNELLQVLRVRTLDCVLPAPASA